MTEDAQDAAIKMWQLELGNDTSEIPNEDSLRQSCSNVPENQAIESDPIYRPLKGSEIRLLEILPSAYNDDALECRLITVELDDDPIYLALSYVWGPSTEKAVITLDGKRTTIGLNLYAALQQLRLDKLDEQYPEVHFSKPQLLFWADAICINQDDQWERSFQVSLMTKIYSNAKMVIAWLGKGNSTLWLAMDILSMIYEGTQVHGRDLEWSHSVPGLWDEEPAVTQPDIVSGVPAPASSVEAIMSFIHPDKLENWSRIWIVQEIVLARRLILKAGSRRIPWEALETFVTILIDIRTGGISRPSFSSPKSSLWIMLNHPSFLYCMESLTAIMSFRETAKLRNSTYQSMRVLFPELAARSFYTSLGSFKATKPRDQVYAMIGIMGLNITPDYSLSVREIYCEFTRSLFRLMENLSILQHTGLGFNYFNKWDLPSFVLDPHHIITTNPEVSIPNLKEFSASLKLPTGVGGVELYQFLDEFDSNIFNLKVNGCIIDTVDQLFICRDDVDLMNLLSKITTTDVKPDIPALQLLFRTLLADQWDGTASMSGYKDYMQPLYDDLMLATARAILFIIQLCEILQRDCDDGYERLLSATEHSGSKRYNNIAELVMTNFDPYGDQKRSRTEWYDILKRATKLVSDSSLAQCVGKLHLSERPLFWTVKHRMGLTTPGTLPGDLVCVLSGCNFPVVLRRDARFYRHVGPCYVCGLMNGEAAEMVGRRETKVQEFIIT